MIIDNADTTDVPFDQFLPSCCHGRILFTTRDKRLAARFGAAVVPVQQMELEDAMALYRSYRHTGPLPEDRKASNPAELKEQEQLDAPKDVEDLAKHLGRLPMAIQLAAAYLREINLMPGANMSIFEYMSALQSASSLGVSQPHKEMMEELLQFREAYSPYPHSMLTVWELSLQLLKKDSPIAVKLLELLGFLKRNVSEAWLTASTGEQYTFEFDDENEGAHQYTASRSPCILLRTEMGFLAGNLSLIISASKLCNLSLARRIYRPEKNSWSLEMHPLTHMWARCRFGANSIYQATQFRRSVLLCEFCIGSVMIKSRLQLPKSEPQQAMAAFEGLVTYKNEMQDLPIECITFYLCQILENNGRRVKFNESTLGVLLSKVVDNEKPLAALLANAAKLVLSRLEEPMREYGELDGEEHCEFWLAVSQVLNVSLNSAVLERQRTGPVMDTLAWLIWSWWKGVKAPNLETRISILKGTLPPVAVVKLTLDFLDKSFSTSGTKASQKRNLLLHSREALVSMAICQLIPARDALNLLETHLDAALQGFSPYLGMDYFEKFRIALNDLCALELPGPWGPKMYRAFVTMLKQRQLSKYLLSGEWKANAIFTGLLRDNPQRACAIRNQSNLRELYSDICRIMLHDGMKEETYSVLAQYILHVGDFPIVQNADAENETTLWPAHWQSMASDFQFLFSHFQEDCLQAFRGNSPAGETVRFACLLLSGYLTLSKMHFEWKKSNDRASVHEFSEQDPDFEWKDEKVLFFLAGFAPLIRDLIRDDLSSDAVGDRDIWNTLVEVIQRRDVSSALKELQMVMPLQIFVRAASSVEQPPHIWVETIFNPMFGSMLDDYVDGGILHASTSGNETPLTAESEELVRNHMTGLFMVLEVARSRLVSHEAQNRSFREWLTISANKLNLTTCQMDPSSNLYCDILETWEADLDSLRYVLRKRGIDITKSVNDLPISQTIGGSPDDDKTETRFENLRLLIKEKGDEFFEGPKLSYVSFDSNDISGDIKDAETIVVPMPAWYLTGEENEGEEKRA